MSSGERAADFKGPALNASLSIRIPHLSMEPWAGCIHTEHPLPPTPIYAGRARAGT